MSLAPIIGPAPSIRSGYARSASESAYPGLWREMTSAHLPSLGQTGVVIQDFSGQNRALTVSRPWARVRGTAIHMTPAVTSSYAVSSDNLVFSGTNDTVLCWYEKSDATLRNGMAYGVNSITAAEWFGAQFPWGDGNLYAYYGGSTGNNILGPLGGLTYGNDVWIHYGGSNGHAIYQNGNLITSKGAVSKTVAAANWGPGAFAGFGNDLAYVRALVTWRRELTPAEISLLSKDPLAPWRLKAPSVKQGLNIAISESSSLALTETDLLTNIFINESSALSLTETDALALSTAKFNPLIISAGQVRELPAGAFIDTGSVTESLTNGETGDIVFCQPVYISASNEVSLARANAIGTSRVIGLVADEVVGTGATANVIVDGVLQAGTTFWDAVTGDTGGLTPGSMYYVSPSTAGELTTTATTTAGEYQVPIGVALSTTKLRFQPGEVVLM